MKTKIFFIRKIELLFYFCVFIFFHSCAECSLKNRDQRINDYIISHPEDKHFEQAMYSSLAVTGMSEEALLLSKGCPRSSKVDVSIFGLKKILEFNNGEKVYINNGKVVPYLD
jgi:hypothetical protein